VLRTDPLHTNARINLGVLLMDVQKDFAAAEIQFREVV